MKRFSTREAAKQLGLSHTALVRYVEARKIPTPETVNVGGRVVHSWSEEQIENVRKLLPKIANGRKTRWQRQPEAQKKKQTKSKKK